MGGNQSSSSDSHERVQSAGKLFSQNEREQIQQIFYKINPFTRENVVQFLSAHMNKTIGENLYLYMTYINQMMNKKSKGIDEDTFLVALAHILKGSIDESTALVLYLVSGVETSETDMENMRKFMVHLVESYIKCLKGSKYRFQSWEDLLTYTEATEQVATAALQGLKPAQGSSVVNEDDISRWLSQNAFLLRLLSYVCQTCFPVSSIGAPETSVGFRELKCLLPMNETQMPNTPKKSELLSLPAILYINHHVPEELHYTWRLLYSTSYHGQSFATMLKGIDNQGPSLLVIKDNDGHIFGGFSSQSWKTCPQFIGSSSCFLFSVHPKLESYMATGYNENYMYLNHGQETLPNGLGMGGQFGFFGLWLDYDFGHGHSRAKPQCTTYGSPQLSGSPDFSIHTVEVWGVGPPPKVKKTGHEEEEEGRESILDKDPEAKAMLSLLDKGPVSEGLREADPTSDIPEEHSLPPL